MRAVSDAVSALLAFQCLCIPALGFDGLIEHADCQRNFVAATLCPSLEMHIKPFRLKVAIGVVVDEVDRELFFQSFYQMPRIGAVAAQVEIDRGGEADGFAFGQAEYFVQHLHEQVHGVVVGEVGGEVHDGLQLEKSGVDTLSASFQITSGWVDPSESFCSIRNLVVGLITAIVV